MRLLGAWERKAGSLEAISQSPRFLLHSSLQQHAWENRMWDFCWKQGLLQQPSRAMAAAAGQQQRHTQRRACQPACKAGAQRHAAACQHVSGGAWRGQKRHRPGEHRLAVLFTLEEGCLGSWPLHRATPLHPDKAQRQPPLTDNSLLPPSPSLLHLWHMKEEHFLQLNQTLIARGAQLLV